MRARFSAALAALRARGVDLFSPADRGMDRRQYEGTVPVERILRVVPPDETRPRGCTCTCHDSDEPA